MFYNFTDGKKNLEKDNILFNTIHVLVEQGIGFTYMDELIKEESTMIKEEQKSRYAVGIVDDSIKIIDVQKAKNQGINS